MAYIIDVLKIPDVLINPCLTTPGKYELKWREKWIVKWCFRLDGIKFEIIQNRTVFPKTWVPQFCAIIKFPLTTMSTDKLRISKCHKVLVNWVKGVSQIWISSFYVSLLSGIFEEKKKCILYFALYYLVLYCNRIPEWSNKKNIHNSKQVNQCKN